MAFTDGEIQPEEIALLRDIACHLTEKDPAALFADYRPDLERVGRKIARSDLGPLGRKLLIKAMAFMAAASGNVTPAERTFYRQCLLAFGVPAAQRQKIEAEVRHMIYAEFLRKKLLASPGKKLDEAGHRELDEKRRSLEIDPDWARRIGAEVVRELA
jgi:tellurite resistance protein